MWLGTDKVFDAFKFYIAETPFGVMQIHGYPYDRHGSTFIVEMREDIWERAGFGLYADRPFAAGESDEKSVARVRELFADVLGDHDLLVNNSRWITFSTIRNERWQAGNVVLLGDAAHTAHFSIGSGTKLAMEDALALAACLREQPGVDQALEAYEQERRPVVASTQRAAQASLEWFENLSQYTSQEPVQFAFNIMTRSRRITRDNLRVRDPTRKRAGMATALSGRPCSIRCGCAAWSWPTASSSPRWTCTPPPTARRATSISRTWAARPSAGLAW
jgi:anthraniloyl-CoA monooxygenase